MEIVFFPTPPDLQKWFRRNHATERELWIGFYKKNSGRPSITWPESVDEALCVGWIDGIRKSIDEESYMIRFTPRRRGSIWSAVNIKRVEVLTNEKRMQPAGLAAFAARRENRSGIYPTNSAASICPSHTRAGCERTRKPGSSSRRSHHLTARRSAGGW